MPPQEAHAELIAVQSQRISDLEAQLAALQQRYDMLKDDTAQYCEARKEAERQAMEMASLVQRCIAQRFVSSLNFRKLCAEDSQWRAAQDVIDQYATKEPTGGEG
jgi:hypothetical protein